MIRYYNKRVTKKHQISNVYHAQIFSNKPISTTKKNEVVVVSPTVVLPPLWSCHPNHVLQSCPSSVLCPPPVYQFKILLNRRSASAPSSAQICGQARTVHALRRCPDTHRRHRRSPSRRRSFPITANPSPINSRTHHPSTIAVSSVRT